MKFLRYRIDIPNGAHTFCADGIELDTVIKDLLARGMPADRIIVTVESTE